MDTPDKRFLKAAQAGDLDEAKRLLAESPTVVHARSTTKGYTALHFAAMGGAIPVVEWLLEQGFDVMTEAPGGVTPLAVALEYKRFNTVRRLQQLRDAAHAAAEKAAAAKAAAEEAAAAKAAARKAAAAKPAAATTAPTGGGSGGGGGGGGGYAAGGLDEANRDAALQALEAGERALRSGDPTKAVRLLEKATRFAGDGGELASRIGVARKEAQAILKEQMADRAESASGGDSPPPPPPRPPPREEESPSAAAVAAAAAAAAEAEAPRRSAADAVKAAALRIFTAWLLPLLLACVTRPWRWLAALGGGLKRRAEERWAALLDPETHERLRYVFYYWRARFRTPLRLLLVLAVLALAWRHPWKAYAIVVVGLSGLGVWITPHMSWGAVVPQPAAAALAGALWLLCWALPWTFVYLLSLSLWGLTLYASWQIGLGGAALLLCYWYFPSVVLSLLGLAVWGFFFVIIPKPWLLLTEYAAFSYYDAFICLFTHVALLGLLFCYHTPWLLLPLAGVLLLLWYLPYVVLALVLLALAWLLYPLLAYAKGQLVKLLENPYGVGEPPEKVKTAEAALAASTASGCNHYEALNSYRAASPLELKGSYKRMALFLHPDKNPSEQAVVGFKRVQDAYDTLSDALLRAEYDATLDTGGPAPDADEASEQAEKDKGADVPLRPSVPDGPPGIKNRRARPGRR